MATNTVRGSGGYETAAGSIEADETASDVLQCVRGSLVYATVSGTFSATVKLQSSIDGVVWDTIEEYTEPAVREVSCPCEGMLVRFYVDTGDYSSGTIVTNLRQDET